MKAMIISLVISAVSIVSVHHTASARSSTNPVGLYNEYVKHAGEKVEEKIHEIGNKKMEADKKQIHSAYPKTEKNKNSKPICQGCHGK